MPSLRSRHLLVDVWKRQDLASVLKLLCFTKVMADSECSAHPINTGQPLILL